MRFATTATGNQLSQAFKLLDQNDVVDEVLKAVVRADRAPKGGLQRTLEAMIQNSGKKD